MNKFLLAGALLLPSVAHAIVPGPFGATLPPTNGVPVTPSSIVTSSLTVNGWSALNGPVTVGNASTMTVTGNAFSVGGTKLSVNLNTGVSISSTSSVPEYFGAGIGGLRITDASSPYIGLERGTNGSDYKAEWGITTSGRMAWANTTNSASKVEVLSIPLTGANANNVGIGTTAPANPLQVLGTTGFSVGTDGSTCFGCSAAADSVGVSTAVVNGPLFIEKSEQVLTFNSSGANRQIISERRNGAGSELVIGYGNTLNTPGTAVLAITDGSGVGISTVAPTATFVVGISTGITISAVTGHIEFLGSQVPAIACDAGSPTITAGANDSAGYFVGGAASANCTVTFRNAFSSAPSCFCNDDTAILALKATATATAVTCTSATTIGTDTVNYLCIGTR